MMGSVFFPVYSPEFPGSDFRGGAPKSELNSSDTNPEFRVRNHQKSYKIPQNFLGELLKGGGTVENLDPSGACGGLFHVMFSICIIFLQTYLIILLLFFNHTAFSL